MHDFKIFKNSFADIIIFMMISSKIDSTTRSSLFMQYFVNIFKKLFSFQFLLNKRYKSYVLHTNDNPERFILLLMTIQKDLSYY